MAKMKSGWVITAKLDEDTNYMFFYDTRDFETALEEFYHEDYCEHLIECDNSSKFSLDCKAVGIPDDDGLVELEKNIVFDVSTFRHYFDLGWSASSKEKNKLYTWKQFIKDVSYDGEYKEKYALVLDLEGAAGEHSRIEVYNTEADVNRVITHDFKPMYSPTDGTFEGLAYGTDDKVLHYEVKRVYDYSQN